MTYAAAEARQQLLDTVAEAVVELATALGALGEAYELLDEDSGDRLEEALFRPVQSAYAVAQRAHAGFAGRHGLPTRTFAPAAAGAVAHDPRVVLDRALQAVEEADLILSELQDSMMPVEVGDPELRAGLAAVRELLGGVGANARRFVSGWGR